MSPSIFIRFSSKCWKNWHGWMVIVPIRKNCKSEIKRFCWWQLVESAILLSVVANRSTFNLKRLFHLSSLNFFFLERKHNPSSHHGATDHVPEKKFKSEALLSTLTSDASKENTPGSLNCLTFYYFWIEGREIQLYVCFLLFFFLIYIRDPYTSLWDFQSF